MDTPNHSSDVQRASTSGASAFASSSSSKIGAVLVAGAGITGIQSALDLAGSGFKVYLVEPGLAIGGRMAQLDKTFPTGDCSMCILSPKLVECARNKNIEILTLSEVESVSGEPGNFEVTLRRRPRYVDADKCNACGECSLACPVVLPNEFDRSLGQRKAIFRPYPQAIPNVYGISKADGIAPCKGTCPAGVNAQGYVALIAAGKFHEAYELIRERCPLPAVCGRICHHPCQAECNRKEIDEPVAVRDLKRFAADYVYEHRAEHQAFVQTPAQQRPERIAIVGGGPAGLTAARDLSKRGYHCTILESRSFLGGMLRLGVPAYRLPRHVLDREIDDIVRNSVEVRPNTKLGRDVTLESLKREGFAAIFVATGAHSSNRLELGGDDAEGLYYGLDFLGRVNLREPVEVGDKVVVIGGGNVAMDAARAALRMGANQVTVAYRRGRTEMPALPEELVQAEQEGVKLRLLTNPIRVIKDRKGRVKGLECLKMQLGEPDASGRRRPEAIQSSEFVLDAKTVIIAVGQTADLEGVSLCSGKLKTNESRLTEVEGVFAGGDVVLGPASLVEAMAHGHQAAEAIHAYLNGKSLPKFKQSEQVFAALPNPAVPALPKLSMPRLAEGECGRDFREIDLGYTREQAIAEAKRCLACGLCSDCGMCTKVCSAGAISHDMLAKTEKFTVGSIVLTPGYEEFQASLRGEFGHGRYANVLSSVQFERMLSASGPTEGKVLRPSDGAVAKRICFIQCVGSRDPARGNPYCSSICCMSATKEAVVAMDHADGLEVTIFCMDVRAFGKEFDAYVERAKADQGVRFLHAMPSRVVELPGSKSPQVRYISAAGQEIYEEFDLVVLSVGMRPNAQVNELAKRLGVDLNQFGFCQTDRLAPMAASRPGIFVAGAFQEPKDIPESVAQASAAAACAMESLAAARNTKTERHEYPWERDVTDEAPRVGVFICHCGHNIASVVDVEAVAASARKLKNTVHVETNLYACSDTSQQHIKDLIREHRLNRLVVASCSPRTHEILFQETLRESGLNQYLFAMANIRDQCSWVHRNEPEAATEKAKDLMRMAVARARQLKALATGRQPVTQAALVIGGGLAGMTSALALAEQGFQVHLLEKAAQLGGQLRAVHYTLEHADVAGFLAQLVASVQNHPKIKLYLNSTPLQISGHVGHFSTRIQAAGKEPAELTIAHGVVILAIGGKERETKLYLYGQNDHVLLQSELEERVAKNQLSAVLGADATVVMIQCVGSRDAAHPYCSRVCCASAIKNALALKQLNLNTRVVVLYRDMRTYGFRELYYQQAREAGVIFIRYPDGTNPEVTVENGTIAVAVTDGSTNRPLKLQPDLLVLSTGIAPSDDNLLLSGLLRTALTSDGFFLEAHPKLRPVDLANEGEYLCGLAHSPRFIDETIAQAKAVAGRAATVLSRSFLEIAGQVAKVNPSACVACATCVKVCPYGAPMINELNKAEIQGAKCMGCGSCAAVCPARTIKLQHQEEEYVAAMMDELLGCVGGAS